MSNSELRVWPEPDRPCVMITGIAGFIGYHVARHYISEGYNVLGWDEINDYYDVSLKWARLRELELMVAAENAASGKAQRLQFFRWPVSDFGAVQSKIHFYRPSIVIHLAAQAGVRYSIDHPFSNVRKNIEGHLSVMLACQKYPEIVEHFVYASSSSVYGNSASGAVVSGEAKQKDWSGVTEDYADLNVESPYAATKACAEMMSTVYSKIDPRVRQTGLRFFTVYGEWGRPDMAYYSFAKKIMKGETLQMFNGGDVHRDYTYVGDIVEGIVGVAHSIQAFPPTAHEVVNIGYGEPQSVLQLVQDLEVALGRRAIVEEVPMQPGDVYTTWADCSAIHELCGWSSRTPLELGIEKFADWFRIYHKEEFA